MCHAHSNAHKPPKNLDLSRQYLSIDLKEMLPRPQATQNCGAHSFNARKQMLTAMYWYRQYLSIDLL